MLFLWKSRLSNKKCHFVIHFNGMITNLICDIDFHKIFKTRFMSCLKEYPFPLFLLSSFSTEKFIFYHSTRLYEILVCRENFLVYNIAIYGTSRGKPTVAACIQLNQLPSWNVKRQVHLARATRFFTREIQETSFNNVGNSPRIGHDFV